MTPQPIPGTLLAAFQRFQQLSCFWQRAHGTPELALSEMTEYIRLSQDIPAIIHRLTAFSELGTDAMFAAYAKAKAAPPRKDAGHVWRMLEPGEEICDGDELLDGKGRWLPCCATVGCLVRPPSETAYKYRRRIAKELPQDTVGHIRADYQGKREESGKACDCGASKEAWRMLEIGERVQLDDEWQTNSDERWWPATSSIGEIIMCDKDRMRYRRRVTPPTPATEPPQP